MNRLYLLGILNAGDLARICWEGYELIVIKHKDICLLAITEPAPEVLQRQEFILKHAQLLEELAQLYSLLPVRYGTVIESRRQAEELMQKEYERFRRLLHAVAGRVEMGLRAIWTELRPSVDVVTPSRSGKEYMQARLQVEKANQSFLAKAENLGKQIVEFFDWADAHTVRYLVTDKLFFNAAFLIERSEIDTFRQKVDEVKAAFPHLKFLASGPWPPYNFSGEAEEGRRHD